MIDRGARLARAGLILMAIGATLGVLLDAIHSHFGATTYTNPVVAGTAWWVPFLFAGAYSIGVARPLLRPAPRPPCWKVGLAMSLFAAAYAWTVAPIPWVARAGTLLGAFAAGFWICDRTWGGLVIALAAAIAGPAVERFLLGAGVFVHHEVHWMGVPGWLPFLYMNAAVGLGTLGRWLAEPEDAEG